MRRFESLPELFTLLLQADKLALHTDDRRQHGLGLLRQVDRALLQSIAVVEHLRGVHLVLQRRQLLSQKFEGSFRLFGAPLHILAHVDIGYLIQRSDDCVSVEARQVQIQHGGLPPLLRHAQPLLNLADCREFGAPDHYELGVRPGLEQRDEDGDLANTFQHCLGSLAHRPFQNKSLFRVVEAILALLSCHQCQRHVVQRVRHFQRFEFDLLSAPGVLGQVEPGLGHLTAFGFEYTGYASADFRKIFGFGI